MYEHQRKKLPFGKFYVNENTSENGLKAGKSCYVHFQNKNTLIFVNFKLLIEEIIDVKRILFSYLELSTLCITK